MASKGIHKPRKICDTNILRCMLLNINEHYDSTYIDYGIDEQRFNVLMAALTRSGIAVSILDSKPCTTKDYAIADVEEYYEWSKGGFYRQIEKFILPILNVFKA